MTIQNIILSCILLVMGTSTIAQSLKEIKKNKDIIWAAEQETNYLFIDIYVKLYIFILTNTTLFLYISAVHF